MIIFAIDPGPKKSAYVCWDTEKSDFAFDKARGLCHEILDNYDLLSALDHLKIYDVNLVAIEMIQNYGHEVGRDIFKTCLWIGRFSQAVYENYHLHQIKTKLYGRATIKGHFQARNDAGIRQALRIRHGEARKGEKLEGVKKDIWAALALAIALQENYRLKEW